MDSFYQKLVAIEYVLCQDEKTLGLSKFKHILELLKKVDDKNREAAEELKKEAHAFTQQLKDHPFTEVLYLVLVYQKTVRIKVITIQNSVPIFCELLDEIEIDTQNYYKNVTQPSIACCKAQQEFHKQQVDMKSGKAPKG